MKTLISSIRQIDGTVRYVYAQDVEHARIAREILRQDPAMIDHLHGVDGIQITLEDRE
jgi:hypothetical protein